MADAFGNHYHNRMPAQVAIADITPDAIAHAYAARFPAGYNPSDGADETLVPLNGIEIATGANEVVGGAGAFTPHGAEGFDDLAALQAAAPVANPATLWTTGSHVVLRDGSLAHWDNAAWAAGAAP